MRYCNYAFLILPFILLGCGGSQSEDHIEVTPPTEPTPEATAIYTPNVMLAVQTGATSQIDLQGKIQTSAPDSVYISDVNVLNKASEQCQASDIKDLSFTVSPKAVTACEYSYTVTNEANTASAEGYLRVSAQNHAVSAIEGEAVVVNSEANKLFSAVTSLGVPVTVDVAVEGFNLDPSSLVLLGSGAVSLDENYANSIVYTPSSETSGTGVSRVFFSYLSDDESLSKLGTLDIAVSSVSSNAAPIAPSFLYGDLTQKAALEAGEIEQLPHIETALNTEVIIDIAPYFDKGLVDNFGRPIAMLDSNGDPVVDDQGVTRYFYQHPNGDIADNYVPGSTLVDADGDAVQVVKVEVYNAVAKTVDTDAAGNIDFNSTRFSFYAAEAGIYYVAYQLDDHQGAFSTGIIEVQAGPLPRSKQKPWEGLVTENAILSAPLSGDEADALFIPYVSISLEDGTNGPDQYGTPLMTWDRAVLYCNSIGGVLPTISQLAALAPDFPTGLYTSLDIYNPAEEKQDMPINWPTSKAYWTQTQDVDRPGHYYAVPVNESGNYDISASYNSASNNNAFAVTCSIPGLITAITGTSGAYRQPLDAEQFNTVTVTVSDFSDFPLADAEVKFSSPANIFIEPSVAVTDQNGQVTVNVSSRQSGNVEVTARAFRSSMTTTINFLDVPRYVRSTDDREVCFYETLELMATGDCENAGIRFDDGDFYQGENYDSITDDGTFILRRYAGNIYTYLDMISATKNPTTEKRDGERGYLTRERAERGVDDDAMFYDGQYYWRAFDSRVNGFSTIGNMASNRDVIREINASGDTRYAMAYDSKTGRYLRVFRDESDSSQYYIQGYLTIEDMVSNTANYEFKIPYENTDQYRDKFVVIN